MRVLLAFAVGAFADKPRVVPPEGAVGLLLHAGPRHLAGRVGAFGERRFSVHDALETAVGQRRDRDGTAFERPHPFDRVGFRGGGARTANQGGEEHGGGQLERPADG